MKKNYTHISFVLDRSGSMQSIKSDVIGNFNRFLEDQKRLDSEATFTLVQFDDEYQILQDFINLQYARPLDEHTYQPRYLTALLDAVGRTIVNTGNKLLDMVESNRPERVIFVILTDGLENASKEYTLNKINEMITHQRNKYNWEFIFLGANQDAIATACKMGIGQQSSMTYDTKHTGHTFNSLSEQVTSCRIGNAVCFSDSDRKSAVGV